MTDAELVAKRIIYLCKKKEITINKLASLSELTQSTVDSIVNGKSQNPRLSTLRKIASGLDMTFTEFFNFPPYNQIKDE